MEVVNEYAERMIAGDKFPEVVLFGDKDKSWIGDGWHRISAARQLDLIEINVDLKPGTRTDALKYALSANSLHGHRRTNADKRRCVEIALEEFPKMSSRAIAEMCGVSDVFVGNRRNQVLTVSSKKDVTIGLDGKERGNKEYPIYKDSESKPEEKSKSSKTGPPSDGMQFARMAVMDLEQIKENDLEREEAFNYVKEWINEA